MHTRAKILAAVGALAFFGLLLALLATRPANPVKQSPSDPQTTFVSPKGETSVNIIEQRNEDGTGKSMARFTAVHHGIKLADHEYLSSSSIDGHFFAHFPSHQWTSESIIRFIRVRPPEDPQRAEITIVNESNLSLRYLRIVAGDFFILFQISPQSTTVLEAPNSSLQRGKLSYVSVGGRFSDGSLVNEKGVDFNTNHKYVDPARYRIVISDKTTKLESSDFQKRDVN